MCMIKLLVLKSECECEYVNSVKMKLSLKRKCWKSLKVFFPFYFLVYNQLILKKALFHTVYKIIQLSYCII